MIRIRLSSDPYSWFHNNKSLKYIIWLNCILNTQMEFSGKFWECGILFFPHSINMESLNVLYPMSVHCKLYSFLFICNWECRVPGTCCYCFFLSPVTLRSARQISVNWGKTENLALCFLFSSQEPPTMGSRCQAERRRPRWAPAPSKRSLQQSMTVLWLFQNKCFKVSGEGHKHVIFGINNW